MANDSERELFEAWVRTEWPQGPWTTASDGRDGYADCAVDDAWRCWRAARADQASIVAEAVAQEQASIDRTLQVLQLGLPVHGVAFQSLQSARNVLVRSTTATGAPR